MNVIVANKYEQLLNTLNIEVLERISGVFPLEELASRFKNFYYNKMILDITALENYEDINVIQRLSVAIDMSKVILLLDDSPKVNSPLYMSQLVSMGIYNFTKNVDSIPFLIDNPNTYKDVASYHHLNITGDDYKLNEDIIKNNQGKIGQRVIGIKNVTAHAGASTLVYLLKKHLEDEYKVKALEIGKTDLKFFNDNELEHLTEYELTNYFNEHTETDVILIDINDGKVEEFCDEVLYLIEPGLIQLNRLIQENRSVFETLKGKKIILNRSVLSSSDVSDFEKESGSKIFFNMPNIDDKENDIKSIKELLGFLGFTRIISESSNSSFSLFR